MNCVLPKPFQASFFRPSVGTWSSAAPRTSLEFSSHDQPLGDRTRKRQEATDAFDTPIHDTIHRDDSGGMLSEAEAQIQFWHDMQGLSAPTASRDWCTFETILSDAVPYVDSNTQKWSPEEAVLWLQVTIFPQLEGRLLLDAIADLCKWRQGLATSSQRPFRKEWWLLKKELHIDDDEAEYVSNRALTCSLEAWLAFNDSLKQD